MDQFKLSKKTKERTFPTPEKSLKELKKEKKKLKAKK